MGEGMRRCCVAAWGKGLRGVHRGNFQVPIGMMVRVGRRQSICHPEFPCHRGAFYVRQMDYDILDSRTYSS